MLLSIGMIVKNEEKYLRRCLEALAPVLKQVESELIIVDTGSTDSTVEIAREFTGKVFHFAWCDDFAAARNEAMRRAAGKWYMTVDADEIFGDVQPLVAFFRSGEYKQFKSAAFIIRSSNQADHRICSEFSALRLVERRDDSHYINAVHEQFGKIYAPTKFLPAVADHYGYVTEDNDEFIQTKIGKRLKILLSELEKDPADGLTYLKISDAFEMLKEYAKALEYCERGLAYAKQGSLSDPLLYSLFHSVIALYVRLQRYDQALKRCDEYFQCKAYPLGTDLSVHILRAESCRWLHRNPDAIQSYRDYLDFYAEFKQGRHQTMDTLQHSMPCVDEHSRQNAVLNLAGLLLEEKEYEQARHYLRSLPLPELARSNPNIHVLLQLEIGLMEKTKDFSEAIRISRLLEGDMLESWRRALESKLDDPTLRPLILNEYAKCDPQNHYEQLMKLRSQYDVHTLNEEAVEEFVSSLDSWTPQYADAIYFAVQYGLDLNDAPSLVDPSDIGQFFFGNVYHHYTDLPYSVYPIYQDNPDGLDIRAQMWVSALMLHELSSDCLREDQVSGLFSVYAQTSLVALVALFREEILCDENAPLLPRQLRIGYYCAMAAQALEAKRNSQYLQYLRIALRLDPGLRKAVDRLASTLQKDIQEADNRSAEMRAYAIQVKGDISRLIEDGKTGEAAQFIQMYESICPGDPEIDELKGRLALA